MKYPLPSFWLPLALVAPIGAQGLVSDINPARAAYGGSSTPMPGVTMQGDYYFRADRWDIGIELWRYDGSSGAFAPVRDIYPGQDAMPQYMCTNGSYLAFRARSSSGTSVWQSDGTGAGTIPVSGAVSSFAGGPAIAGNFVLWVKNVNWSDFELWSSDLANPSPVLLGSYPGILDMTSSGSHVYLSVLDPAFQEYELLRTNGTAAGTAFLDPGPGTGSTRPEFLTADGQGGVWFRGNQSGAGSELWHSDGTVAGTSMVADIRSGSGGSSPRRFGALGNRVFFAAQGSFQSGEELWVSDGTAAGTIELELYPGSNSGQPDYITAIPALNRVFFSGTDGVHGREPWTSDGTAAGTYMLADIAPGGAASNSGYELGFGYGLGVVWFAAADQTIGRELYRTDGTQAGTVLAFDLLPGAATSEPRFHVELNGNALFSGHTGPLGTEIFHLTSISGPPTIIDLDPPQPEGSYVPAASSFELPLAAALDGRHHFTAYGPYGYLPYLSDGTAAGTTRAPGVTNLWNSSTLLGATTTHVYYQRRISSTYELYAITKAGDAVAVASGRVRSHAVLRDRFFFAMVGTSDNEPMVSDGTVAGTGRLADVFAGPGSSTPDDFTVFAERVWFTADDGVSGREIWSTDGTTAGTTLAIDVLPGAGSGAPYLLCPGKTRMYFSSGAHVWITDGTQIGTSSIPTLASSPDLSTTIEDVFLGTDGRDLWRSDGTAAGTHLLLQASSPTSRPFDSLTTAGDQAFFTLPEPGTIHHELWATDGTAAGTQSVTQLRTWYQGPEPRLAPAGWRHVCFWNTTQNEGSELWVSDGTGAGTRLLVDAVPGSISSMPRLIGGNNTTDGRLLWWSATAAEGLEPWTAPLVSFEGSDFDRYGEGCPGGKGLPHIQGDGAPVLGSPRLAYQLRNGADNAFAVLALGFDRLPGSGPCQLLTNPLATAPMYTDGQGRAEYAFAVPSYSALQGVTISGQFLVLDPQGLASGGISGTPGLQVLIGR